MMKGFVTDKPRFFKVILETTISNKLLMLPPTFVENHYLKSVSTNPTTATLTIPSGLTWKVDVVVNTSTTTTNAGPEVWFQGEGWEKFVTSHSLEHGHFIVFQYDGRSNFSVLVFDRSCSEIYYPMPISTKKKPEEAKTKKDADQFEDRDDDDDDDDDVSVEEIIPKTERTAKCATEKANKKQKGSSSRGGFRETKREEEEDDDVSVEEILPEFGSVSKSGKRSRKTELPISNEFTVVIKKTSINRRRLSVPRAFARGLMLKDQTLKLELAAANDSNKQQWEVKACKASTRNEMHLCGGWSMFVMDNSLRDGDVCKFEIMGFVGTHRVIQVSITRK